MSKNLTPLMQAGKEAGKSSADATSQPVEACVKKCNCIEKPTPIDPSKMCQTGCDYYVLRQKDFLKRHTCPECAQHKPPDYYLNYGLKYCDRFTKVTMGKLSPEGQAWLKRARCNLQVLMEQGLQKNPAMELDNDGFRKFAFMTHREAYLKAGMAKLSVKDMTVVAMTPDLKEWGSGDTWSQAVDVGGEVLKSKAGSAAEAVKESILKLFDSD